MSDTGSVHNEEVKAELDLDTALHAVIQKSQINDGLVHGLNEVVKALDRREAQLCILADDCSEGKYKTLVDAFCKQNKIPLLQSKRETMGEWVGYFKVDDEGKPRKVKGVSSICIKDFGEETEAYTFVQNHLKSL